MIPMTLSAQELFPLGNAESEGLKTMDGTSLERTTTDANSGKHAFTLKTKQVHVFEPLIPVETGRAYHLSVKMKSVDGRKPASANFGIYLYDEEKRQIGLCHVSAKEGTQTKLLKPLEAGSTVAWLEKRGEWLKPAKHYRIVLNVKKDLSDLPNFALSPRMEEMEETGEGWKVTFQEPVEKSYPAGTAVRQHSAFLQGLYWVTNEWVPTEWTTYSTTLQGEALSGTPKDKFWRGTRYVRVMVRFGNWDRVPEEGAELLVDEISFRTVPSQNGEDGREE